MALYGSMPQETESFTNSAGVAAESDHALFGGNGEESAEPDSDAALYAQSVSLLQLEKKACKLRIKDQ